MKPKVSVIVPVRNREKLVKRCLDSVLHQTVLPYELIVVDNNSTDNTVNVVKDWINEHQDSGFSIQFLMQQERGACPTRQKGLENATGKYVIFFDSDDTMHHDLIAKAMKEIEEYPDADIVCWKCRIHLLDGKTKVPSFMPENPLESHLIHTLLRPQGYMVKKSFIEKSGGWNKPLKVWNDFELGLRLLMMDPKLVGIDEVLAEIYSQRESITGLDFSSKEGEWEKTLGEVDKEANKRESGEGEKVLRILDYRRAILAAHYYREGNKKGARKLIKATVEDKGKWEKFILKFSYYFTAAGFRGAWRLVRFAY